MLKITKKTEYALIALSHIASNDALVRSIDISKKYMKHHIEQLIYTLPQALFSLNRCTTNHEKYENLKKT